MKFLKPHGSATINDVKYSPLNSHLLVTSGSDGYFKVWDSRDCGYKSIMSGHGSDNELNCATFNNVNPNLLAVAGEESGLIGVWDLRMPQMVINDLSHHTKQVTVLDWHPSEEQILMSSGEDGKVFIWDNSKCGEEQARKDYEDGPPELIFPHIHHSSLIEDVCW
jgi:WD40 repeat protein